MSKNEIMNVAFCTDENYINYAIVSIVSLFENNKDAKICVWLITNSIREEKLKYLQDICIKYDQCLKIVEKDSIMPNIKQDNTFSYSAYIRLFLSNLPIDKILYFDCDSAITSSIKFLYNTNIDDFYFAAALDVVSSFYRTSIGLNKDMPYVNSGMLLMNLKKLREEKWVEKVISLLERNHGSIPHHDQGIINALGMGKIKILSAEFNVIDYYFLYTEKQLKTLFHANYLYSQEELNYAIEKPTFIHFVAGNYGRVWDVKCRHPLKEVYREYVNKTGFNEIEFYTDKPENKNACRMRRIEKMLPFWLYCFVYDLTIFRKKVERLIKHKKISIR